MIKKQAVDYKSIFFITSTLSTYIKSGIPLIKSLELIKVSMDNLVYKNSLDKIINSLKNGEILSEAMKKEKTLYPNLLIDMLKIGEESGKLDEVLIKVATHFSRRNDIVNNIKKIMIYPIFLIISIFLVAIFYLLYILPSFEQLYKDLDGTSSVMISKIIEYIDFINNNDQAILIIVCYLAVFILSIILIIITFKNKNIFMKLSVVKKYYELNIIFMLELIVSSGVSVRKALDLLVDTITCPITKKYFIYIKKSLWQGQSLSEVISNIDIMSSLTTMFIFSGEESGRLENNIKTLSHMLDEEFFTQVNSIKGKIEPITTLILGIMVFLMALMIFVPMYGYMNYA